MRRLFAFFSMKEVDNNPHPELTYLAAYKMQNIPYLIFIALCMQYFIKYIPSPFNHRFAFFLTLIEALVCIYEHEHQTLYRLFINRRKCQILAPNFNYNNKNNYSFAYKAGDDSLDPEEQLTSSRRQSLATTFPAALPRPGIQSIR